MPQKSFIRSSSKAPSTTSWSKHNYNLRGLVSLSTPSQATPPTPKRISASSTTTGKQSSLNSSGSTRTSSKRKRSRSRSRSRLVLPTVAPTPPKRRRIDRRRPLVTLREAKEETGDDGEVIIVATSSVSAPPTAGRHRGLVAKGNLTAGASVQSSSIPSIKKPIQSLRKSVPRCRRHHRSPSQEDSSEVEFVSSCVPFGKSPPQLKPAQRLSRPKLTHSVETKQATLQPTIRIPPAKQDKTVQTESFQDQDEGGSLFTPPPHEQGQVVLLDPQYEETAFGYLEMKLLEERTHSWGQYTNAEDEMNIVVQNYFALEQELAETKEQLRRAKNHKKRV